MIILLCPRSISLNPLSVSRRDGAVLSPLFSPPVSRFIFGDSLYMHADLSDARAAGLCPALAVMGESAKQSLRQRVRTSVNRFMEESFRLNGFKLRLSVRCRWADSTPGDSRCEEKSRAKMRQAERAVDRSCHIGDRCPTRLVISATSAISECNYRAELTALSVGQFAGAMFRNSTQVVPIYHESRSEARCRSIVRKNGQAGGGLCPAYRY